ELIRPEGIGEDGYPLDSGQYLPEKLHPFCCQLAMKEQYPRDVRPRSREVVDVTELDRVIVDAHNDDGDLGAGFFGGTSPRIRGHYDDIHVQADQFGGEAGEPVGLSFGIPELDGEILALDVAQLVQSLLKSLKDRSGAGIAGRQYTDPVRLRLLAVGGERRKKETENDREPDQPHAHLLWSMVAGSLRERRVAHQHDSARDSASRSSRRGRPRPSACARRERVRPPPCRGRRTPGAVADARGVILSYPRARLAVLHKNIRSVVPVWR